MAAHTDYIGGLPPFWSASPSVLHTKHVARHHDYLKIYESQEIAMIEAWPSIKLDLFSLDQIGYDPNLELDWRNQASAHTDCLLKYKEAAQFIIFGDVDDVLLPKLGISYIEEFRLLSHSHPTAAGFTYSRYNTALNTGTTPQQFSLSQVIGGAEIANEWEDGKYVVNTSRVETAWLHYPGSFFLPLMFTIPDDVNIMVHLRNWTLHSRLNDGLLKHKTPITAKPLHKTQINDLISNEALKAIQVNFNQLMHSTNYTAFLHLPVTSHYLPLIVECYNTMFYSVGRKPTSCPGPLKCQLPSIPGLKCSVASTFFRKKSISWRTSLQIAENPGQFVTNLNGCSL
uniref:Glycosyltransferase family 92 protein n=1 Tax=Ditylenchus dipsaci TaxID=166011 RepID=A0A915ENS6_9BILA